MKLKLLALTALLLLPLSAGAQRNKKKPAKKAKPAEEEMVEDPRLVQMRASTQQVMFIDSMVVDATDFMRHIPLSAHVGKLTQTGSLGTFTTEMGDHRLASLRKDSTVSIVSSDFIANRWTEPQPLGGLGQVSACNPFLMPDGITLYFAQKGSNAIGGYDIFVTRYDSERGTFLKAENLGMPFASEANDLFYAIDEFNLLGYFVTDRRQPRGKVCIYTFIPQERRRTYQPEAYSDQQLRSLASIGRIADTWTDKQQLNEAIQRLQAARSVASQAQTADHISKTPELDAMRHEADVQAKALAIERNRYATASESERATLRIKILSAEQQLEDLQTTIRQKEKQIPYNN